MPKHWKKIIVSLIVISTLVFFPIQTARSAGAIAYIQKEFGWDIIARIFARNFLSKLINNTTDFLGENGRDGLPNFVQDWRYFLEDAQYRGEDITRAIIGDAIDFNSGTICEYLRGPLGSAFGASKIPGFTAFKHRVDSLQPYKTRNQCPFPGGFTANDANLFRNDFSAGGGWATWDKLIQPQGNFFGVYADSLDEVGRQRSFEQERDRSEAEAGSGFTSKMSGEDGCKTGGGNSFCLVLGDILTPAKVLEQMGSRMNISEFDWVAGCDEISECIFNIMSSFVGRLGNLVAQEVSDSFTERPEDVSRLNELEEKARADCIKAGENTCTEKAKKLDCDASATGGSGGSGGSTDSSGSGGSGGDANVDCVEIIDSGIYNACMAEVNNNCNIQR